MQSLTASDRVSLIKLASSLPKGSPERKAILAGLSKAAKTEEGSGSLRRPLSIGGAKYTDYKWEISPSSIYIELFNDHGDSAFADKKEYLANDELFDAAVADIDESLRAGNLPDGFDESDF